MIKDALGNYISPGDIISYPVRLSSSMWLNFAVVTEVMNDALKVVGLEGFGERKYYKKKTICSVDRVIAVTGIVPDDNEEFKYLLELSGKIAAEKEG